MPTAEIFNIGSGSFSTANTMIVPRAGATATLLPSGLVLVAGGGKSCRNFWPIAFKFSGIILFWPEFVFIYSGGRNGAPLSSAELYNPTTGAWTLTSGPMATTRADHIAVFIPSIQRVLIAGGTSGNLNEGTSSAELYDPVRRNSKWRIFSVSSINQTVFIRSPTLFPQPETWQFHVSLSRQRFFQTDSFSLQEGRISCSQVLSHSTVRASSTIRLHVNSAALQVAWRKREIALLPFYCKTDRFWFLEEINSRPRGLQQISLLPIPQYREQETNERTLFSPQIALFVHGCKNWFQKRAPMIIRGLLRVQGSLFGGNVCMYAYRNKVILQ